jgi:hypothetical protein
MLDYDKYFLKEYQFHLKEVKYEMLKEASPGEQYELICEDYINTEILQEKKLYIVFLRQVKFKPNALYNLSVSFGAVFTFKDEAKNDLDLHSINWGDEVVDNWMKFLSNITSRASMLISQITSSYGQSPVVTPPNIIKEVQKK